MQLGGGMRGQHYPMLLGQLSYAQGLGEAGGAGCVELHVTDAALDNKIAYREAGQLALAISNGSLPIARRTAPIRSASSATVPPPVLSLTAR